MWADVVKWIETLSENQCEVMVAIIGLISAGLVSIVGFFGSTLVFSIGKHLERKTSLKSIKEKQYIDFLSSIAEAKVASTNEQKYEINKKLSSVIQTMYLVGNKKVQESLRAFLKSMTGDGVRAEEQNGLYTDLIIAMKQDLYGKKSETVDKIDFTVFI